MIQYGEDRKTVILNLEVNVGSACKYGKTRMFRHFLSEEKCSFYEGKSMVSTHNVCTFMQMCMYIVTIYVQECFCHKQAPYNGVAKKKDIQFISEYSLIYIL